ncbi:MAG: nucleotidyltransferase family protein [Anaerolineae bacterium]|nr:nucleotidyltransferase family protein [Anaerolineae bacterium]
MTAFSPDPLFQCLRRLEQGEDSPSLRALVAEEFPWPYVLSSLPHRDLLPLLYHRLRRAGLGAQVPAWAWARLEALYRLSLLRNDRLFTQLEEVLSVLSAAGVEAVLLKGAALALTVYDSPALRPMRDIDLLVPREMVQEAVAALTSQGYRLLVQEVRPGFVYEFENEWRLQGRAPGQVSVELHWHPFVVMYYRRAIPVEELWDRTRPVAVGRQSARLLALEDQLLHLCAHLSFHHGFEPPLLWAWDVAALLKHFALDWDAVVARARRYRLTLPVQAALENVNRDIGAPVPEEVRRALAAHHPSLLERAAYHHHRSAGHTEAAETLLELLALPRGRTKLRFLAGKLFPSRQFMVERYGLRPPSLWAFAYPYRWLKGAVDIVKDAANVVCSRWTARAGRVEETTP